MNTAFRRDALIRLLRRRGPTSVRAVSLELGVSRRTVLRDIGGLRARGFSIVGEAGPGGGVHLDPSSLVVTSQLSAEDVAALVLSVAVMQASPWMPFASGADTALAKIEAALPAERVRELRRFLGRIMVGRPAGPAAEGAAHVVDPAFLPMFEQAFTAKRVLRFSYVDRMGRRTRRKMEPHGLLLRAPLWYVIAWDLRKDAARTFRMDRVRRCAICADERFEPRSIDLLSSTCPDATPYAAGARRAGVSWRAGADAH